MLDHLGQQILGARFPFTLFSQFCATLDAHLTKSLDNILIKWAEGQNPCPRAPPPPPPLVVGHIGLGHPLATPAVGDFDTADAPDLTPSYPVLVSILLVVAAADRLSRGQPNIDLTLG